VKLCTARVVAVLHDLKADLVRDAETWRQRGNTTQTNTQITSSNTPIIIIIIIVIITATVATAPSANSLLSAVRSSLNFHDSCSLTSCLSCCPGRVSGRPPARTCPARPHAVLIDRCFHGSAVAVGDINWAIFLSAECACSSLCCR